MTNDRSNTLPRSLAQLFPFLDLLQLFDLSLAQVSPFTWFQIAELDRPDPLPDQPAYRVPKGGSHPPDLPLAAFVQHNAQPRLARLVTKYGHIGRGCRFAVEDNSLPPLLQRWQDLLFSFQRLYDYRYLVRDLLSRLAPDPRLPCEDPPAFIL